MRYIKKIRDFLKGETEITNRDLYKKIKYEEKQMLLNKFESEYFTDEEIKRISKYVKKYKNYSPKISELIFRIRWIDYFVYKISDEWMIVTTISDRDGMRPQGISTFFKCDGIDGLIGLINNKNAIYEN